MPLTFSNRNPDLSVAEPRPELTDPLTVYIYDTVLIENAVGGGGNDILVGNAAGNRLQGGAATTTWMAAWVSTWRSTAARAPAPRSARRRPGSR